MNISELCKALGYHHDKNNNFARVMKFLSDAVTGLTIPFKVSADSGKNFSAWHGCRLYMRIMMQIP